MITYLADIEPLEALGLDDTQIAYAISVKTAYPIPCESTKVALEGSGAVEEDPVTQTRSGTLIDHYQTLTGNQAKLLSWFISHVMIRGVEITANEYPRCLEIDSVISGLPESLSDVANEIILLGGGQPNIGTTATTVSDVRNAYLADKARAERQVVAAEKQNEFLSPVLENVDATNADIAAALVAWANSYTE